MLNAEDKLYPLLLDLLLNTSESDRGNKLTEQEIQGEVNIFVQVLNIYSI